VSSVVRSHTTAEALMVANRPPDQRGRPGPRG